MNRHPDTTTNTETNGAVPTRTRPRAMPRADILETETHFELAIDMPGVDESTVDVTLERHVLTLRGEARLPEHEGFRLAYAEFEPTDLVRSFQVSGDLDESKIEASFTDGVLRFSIPKVRPEQKKILVRAE